mmetsp:Transcript_31621/g.77522  ORF Transcript_31621/g.77522 Transcript_31621/m.77522 type:complete len:250 (-) Transcript_31621:388-1137(-)
MRPLHEVQLLLSEARSDPLHPVPVCLIHELHHALVDDGSLLLLRPILRHLSGVLAHVLDEFPLPLPHVLLHRRPHDLLCEAVLIHSLLPCGLRERLSVCRRKIPHLDALELEKAADFLWLERSPERLVCCCTLTHARKKLPDKPLTEQHLALVRFHRRHDLGELRVVPQKLDAQISGSVPPPKALHHDDTPKELQKRLSRLRLARHALPELPAVLQDLPCSTPPPESVAISNDDQVLKHLGAEPHGNET